MNILLSTEQVGVAMDELMEKDETDGVKIARHVAKVQVQRIVKWLQDHNINPLHLSGITLTGDNWERLATAADEAEPEQGVRNIPGYHFVNVERHMKSKHPA